MSLGPVDGKPIVLAPGQRFTLLPGQAHLPRNVGADPVEFQATVTPGLDMATMFASLCAATREFRGLGRFARIAMVFRRHRDLIAFGFPVKFVSPAVAFVAARLGVRPPEVDVSALHATA